MDRVSMWKRVKGNPYNYLEEHTPLKTQTSCSFKTAFKDSLCSIEWIDVSYKPPGCIFLTRWIRFFTVHAIKKINF